MTGRAVIHIDLDAFFVSVERKKRPELRGVPVIVGGLGDPAKRGVVSAVSYEARSSGVYSGMPLKTAKKLCPKAVFLPVDFAAYEKESNRFMEILRRYSRLVESFGLDEGFVEVSPGEFEDEFEDGEDIFRKAEDAARAIKTQVKDETGLTASAGIGPNKLLAKLACDLGKPDGFCVITAKDTVRVLENLPVRRLWGVGKKTEKRLKDLGINTVGELAKAPLLFLQKNFGPNSGKTLHEHSLGVDDSPVVPFHEPDSVSREVTFEEDTDDASFIKETLRELASSLAERLKSGRYKGKTITIKVRYSDFKTNTYQAPLERASDSFNDIWTQGQKLLGSVDLDRRLRLVGIKVSGLSRKG